jgi:hypothetical protein
MTEVALIVLAYRQAEVVQAAVDSALTQEGEPLEIILSDDCSPDQTGALMAECAARYRGPHKVQYRASKQNRGSIMTHLQEAVAETNAELIIVQAGDDQSEPKRARVIVEAWRKHGKPTCVICSDFTPIDASGQECGAERPSRGPFTLMGLARGITGPLGATCAFSRCLLTDLPPIAPTVTHEDRVIPFRALLCGGEVLFLPQKLVRYRVEGGISRRGPKSLADYAFRFCREADGRTIEDARQRLRDVERMRPWDRRLVQACRSTIAGQAARIAMSNGRSLTRKYVRALRNGAWPVPLTKHYLKVLALRHHRPPATTEELK